MGVLQKILLAILRPFAVLFMSILRMFLFVLVLLVAAMIFWRGALEGVVKNTLSGLIGVPVVVEGGVDMMGSDGMGTLVSGVVAENPEWAVRDHLLRIETMSVRVNPVSAFFGKMHIHDLVINGLSLALERGAEGAPGLTNYAPVAGALARRHANPYTAEPLSIDAFNIQDASVFLRDGDHALEVDIPVATGRYNPPGAPGGLALDTISLYARGSDMTASLLIEPGPAQPRVSGKVTSSRLDLARLVPHHPALPPMAAAEMQPDDAGEGTGDDALDVQKLAAFLSEYAPLLNHMDVNIRMDIEDLRLPGMSGTDVSLVLWREGKSPLEVRNLSAETP